MLLHLNHLFQSSCNLFTIAFTLCLRGLSFRLYVVSISSKYLNLINIHVCMFYLFVDTINGCVYVIVYVIKP